ncbi:bilirubin oxidase [Streptomyces laurentii]|uniref:Multicopper oxidase CueO n=1 Tax=Streptomyces laurentii TaxID=39478 RepID=A0A160P5S9_STRLU|nr:bilirubin oxidase [Streptomyces laurentii]
MITRRSIIKTGMATGAVGAAGLLVPATAGTAAAAGSAGAAATTDLDPASVPKFTQAMPLAPVATPYMSMPMMMDCYALTMQEANKEILPGVQTRVWTFNGSFPGPVIKARSNVRTLVDQTNNLPVGISVHLHGAHVPADSDGDPVVLIPANGGTKTYTYPNTQPHASLWFHDHAHHAESESAFRGLAGTYLITDDIEQGLNLPSGAYDVPIQLRDARFDDQGQLLYQLGDFQNRNVILANGRAWPFHAVAARKYRLRFCNTANMRTFTLALSDGSSFQQIGSDGGLLPAPITVSQVTLSPGERADVVIDFSRYAVGTTLELVNQGTGGPAEQIGKVLQFRVDRTAADTSVVPSTLRTLPVMAAATVNRSFVLGMGGGIATINGVAYVPDRIDTEVAYGSTEIWTITNSGTGTHNFHVHLVQFRVIERAGAQVTAGPDYGLKDTVRIGPGETVKIQATFTGYRGQYLYHCHIFDHAAMGMMATMRVS